jgi:UDP-2,3-diacylglucosamine pyrophosphatase LpxH
MHNKIRITLNDVTRALVVSDIHLRLPVTRELGLIQKSLIARIKELSKSKQAILILNGDIFELWEQTDQTVADIIEGFKELTEAIQKFAAKRGHRVEYVVGNHDEQIAFNPADRSVVENHWHAEVGMEIELVYGKKTILIQHGHQYDPYNMSTEGEDSRGKRLVQNIMPVLQRCLPKLFNNIGDVTDRSLLAEYVISNFLYKIFTPIVLPIVLLGALVFSAYYKNVLIFTGMVMVCVSMIVLMIIAGFITRFFLGYLLGGGNSFLRKLDTEKQKRGFNVLILGHTHQGGRLKRQGYTYANSGCNDIIAMHRMGWLVLPKFERYLQMSGITIDYSKKPAIEYHHQTIPLVE